MGGAGNVFSGLIRAEPLLWISAGLEAAAGEAVTPRLCWAPQIIKGCIALKLIIERDGMTGRRSAEFYKWAFLWLAV